MKSAILSLVRHLHTSVAVRITGRHRHLAAFSILAAALLLLTLFIFPHRYMWLYSDLRQIQFVIADLPLLVAPLWLLSGRWRRLWLAAVWLLSFILWANAMYANAFGDFINPILIFHPESYNSFVFHSVSSLLEPRHSIYLATPLLLSLAYRRLRISRAATPAPRHRLAIVAAATVCWAAMQLVFVRQRQLQTQRDQLGQSYAEMFRRHFTFQEPYCWMYNLWEYNGVLMYSAWQIHLLIPSHHSLSTAERHEIDSFTHTPHADAPPDCLFAANSSRNLILIVVESLNSDYIGKRAGSRHITPVLDSLICDTASISCTTMVSQAGLGRSSDGQLIYNTGLLPSRHLPAAMAYHANRFHSLAESPTFAHTAEVIGESRLLWNHLYTSRAFHFDTLVDNITEGIPARRDSVIMAAAVAMMKHSPQPFMFQITTIGMHSPFRVDSSEVIPWIDAAYSSRDERRYLTMLHHFDSALGTFISELKSSGLYRNSVIVIASDHDQRLDLRTTTPSTMLPLAFIALNTGHGERVTRPVGQIDVYPTIRRIMGWRGGWEGLGMSMLDPRNSSTVDFFGNRHGTSGSDIDYRKEHAWTISDLILRADYFAASPY